MPSPKLEAIKPKETSRSSETSQEGNRSLFDHKYPQKQGEGSNNRDTGEKSTLSTVETLSKPGDTKDLQRQKITPLGLEKVVKTGPIVAILNDVLPEGFPSSSRRVTVESIEPDPNTGHKQVAFHDDLAKTDHKVNFSDFSKAWSRDVLLKQDAIDTLLQLQESSPLRLIEITEVKKDVPEQKTQTPTDLIDRVWEPVLETEVVNTNITELYEFLRSREKLIDLQEPPGIGYVQGQESNHNLERQEQELSASDNTELGEIERSLKVVNLKLGEFSDKAQEITEKDTPSWFMPEFKEQLKELQALKNDADGLISEILSISSPDEVSDDLSLSEIEKSVYDFQKDHLTEQVQLWTKKIDKVIEIKTQYFNRCSQDNGLLIERPWLESPDSVNHWDDLRNWIETTEDHTVEESYITFE